MKNNSWQHPFPRFGDKFFDSNKDGKLDTVETFFRDMHINEMNRKANEYAGRQKSNSQYRSKNNYAPINNNKNKESESISSESDIIGILLVLVGIGIGIVFAIYAALI